MLIEEAVEAGYVAAIVAAIGIVTIGIDVAAIGIAILTGGIAILTVGLVSGLSIGVTILAVGLSVDVTIHAIGVTILAVGLPVGIPIHTIGVTILAVGLTIGIAILAVGITIAQAAVVAVEIFGSHERVGTLADLLLHAGVVLEIGIELRMALQELRVVDQGRRSAQLLGGLAMAIEEPVKLRQVPAGDVIA